jgi:hypothetical protein
MAVQEVIPTRTRGRDEEGYDEGSCNTAVEVPTQKKKRKSPSFPIHQKED